MAHIVMRSAAAGVDPMDAMKGEDSEVDNILINHIILQVVENSPWMVVPPGLLLVTRD